MGFPIGVLSYRFAIGTWDRRTDRRTDCSVA